MPDATPDLPDSVRPDGRSGLLFDRVFYLAANPDLATLAENPEFDAEEHFWREGIWDGREPSAFYDIGHLQRVLKAGALGPVSRAQALPLFFALPPEERPVPNGWFNPAFFRTRHGADFPEAAALPDFLLFELYAANGGPLALSPNALFDEAGYQARYPDVAAEIAAGHIQSGFQHFVTTGWQEGRSAIPGAWAGLAPDPAMPRRERDALLAPDAAPAGMAWWFDEDFYLALHRDVHAMRRAGTVRSGLEHFLLTGFAEGRAPHPALARLFRERAPDAALETVLLGAAPGELAALLPLAEAAALRRQVLERGWSTDEAGLTEFLWDLVAPAALAGTFDAPGYLAANPDVAALVAAGAVADAAAHWRDIGMAEGRLAPFSNVFAGRRASLRVIARSAAGVNYIGPVSLAGEAGAAARDMVAALEAAGIAVAITDIAGLLDPQAGIDLVAPEELPHGFTLIDLPPDRILPLVARFGTALFERRMTIGLVPAGAPRPAWRPAWRAVLGGFDALLAASEADAAALAAITGRMVLAAPRPLDPVRLPRAARSAAHPALDRLRAAQAAGKRVALFTMGAAEEAWARGLDLFLELARRVEQAEPGAWLFCVKAAARSAAGPGLAPMTGAAPVVLIDEPWPEEPLSALRGLADIAVFPDRCAGAERAALSSIALGVPTLVPVRGALAGVLTADYPLAIPGGPAPCGGGAFEPDPDALLARFTAHFRTPRRFAPWPRRVARRLAPATLGPELRALLAAHCGFDQHLDGLGETLDAATPQGFGLMPRPADATLGAAIAGALAPRFTVVAPLAGTAPDALATLHADLAAQDCPAWELCVLRDEAPEPAALTALKEADARVLAGAAADALIGLGTGAYLLFLRPGDRLEPGLLAAFAARIAGEPAADLLYCDDDGAGPGALGRPDWSPEYLLGTMYLGPVLCLRRALFGRIGGLAGGTGRAGLHDLALRAAAAGARVVHVDRVLVHPGPDRAAPDGGEATMRAVAAHLARLGVAGTVEPGLLPGSVRVRPQVAPAPPSAIVLSGCEHAAGAEGPILHVERFLRSIAAHGTALPLDIDVVVDRGREAAVAHLAALDPAIRIVSHDPPAAGFNFAAKANAAIRAARGETIILLNDDMEALDASWVEALLEPLALPGVGVVGARLLYPDGTLQHAGVVLGGAEAARHAFVGAPGEDPAVLVMRNYAAVTAACIAFRRDTFMQAGGFEERFAVDFNDTDFCLRVLRAGLRVVYTPFACLRHHESQTVVRARADILERRAFERRWHQFVRRDPYAPTPYPPAAALPKRVCERGAVDKRGGAA